MNAMHTDELKSTLLEGYQMRRTRKQKDAFIEWACRYAQALGVSAAVEEGGKYIRSRNIVFGDIDRARTIITAHYDTCAWMPTGAGMTPGCWPLIVIIELIQMLFLLPILLIMFFGPSNRHTANDNTSGVLLVLRLMEKLRDKPGVAFVLLDNEEIGLLGSQAFIKAHPQAARRFLLNLDCVGDGRTLLYTGSKLGMKMPQAKRLTAAMEEIAPQHGMQTVSGPFPKWLYPSDQMLFPRGTAIAALKGKRILYLNRIHTHRDTVLEGENIDCLMDVIAKGL
ncbi:MAG: M28 family peptidase [Clostridia bacterium]|nr:M28 family peptidase [Clostridia bacterium]